MIERARQTIFVADRLRIGDGMDCLPGMRAVEARHAGKIEAHGGCGGTGGLARPVEIGAARRSGPVAGDPRPAPGQALLTLEVRRAEEIAAVLGVHPWTAPGAQGKNAAFSANHGRVQPSIRPGIAAPMAAGPDDNSPLRSLSRQRTLCPMHPAGWTELGKT